MYGENEVLELNGNQYVHRALILSTENVLKFRHGTSP
jgi:hypothetical protein